MGCMLRWDWGNKGFVKNECTLYIVPVFRKATNDNASKSHPDNYHESLFCIGSCTFGHLVE